MTGKPDQSDLLALQTRVSWLWSVYVDERTTDRQRRAIGAEIDRIFDQIRTRPEWIEVFLAAELWD